MKRKPEILAPAGSFDSLKAAVAAGCDAVYMGGERFGARAYADNPKQDDMVRAIDYCHLHGVKLYMTVNTLLKDKEIHCELFDYIRPYYEAGVDAVIVQDLGVMRALHQWFPDLDLHISTQMSLTMGKGLDRFKRYGVTRIVPARELSLRELEQMRRDTDMELEVFVHGALCYCYSGRCLFSSMQGGRSGNRGRCAQPCRMRYHGAGKSGYYLSPRELCNLSHIAELTEAGVDSFKIEGRMKRPEYTAFVTAIYRKYVDLYFALGQDGYRQWQQSHPQEWQEDIRKLAELYNRDGFTSGYLEGQAGGYQGVKQKAVMLSMKRPRHGGVRVGEVISVDAHAAVYRLERDIVPQDVVEFRDHEGQMIYEYTIGTGRSTGETVKARYQKGCRIRVGDHVYRTRHQCLLDEIGQRYLTVRKPLPVEGIFVAAVGQACRLSLSRCGCQVTVTGEIVQSAVKQPATEEAVRKAVTRTGESMFCFEPLRVELAGDVFLPVGMLKQMRRSALQKLEQALLSNGRRTLPEHCDRMTGTGGRDVRRKEQENHSGHPQAVLTDREDPLYSVAVMTLEQLYPVLSIPEVSEIILRMDQLTEEQLRSGARLVRDAGKRLLLGMPAIWRAPVWEQYAREIGQGKSVFWDLEPDGYLIQNMESFTFLREVRKVSAAKIRTDAGLYVMNREAADWWMEQGVQQMTAPWELTGSEWERLEYKDRMQWIVYGHIPLMVSAQCVVCNTRHCAVQEQERNVRTRFRDDKKREFVAVNYCRYCYNVIYQGRPFSILHHREVLRQTGCSSWRYDFTIETGEQVKQILKGVVPEQVESGHYAQEIW